ncbi:MAG TPA: hypothetical protein VH137_07900, partial [Gemmatimonadales bacterium]|nr:hypothetical protein [Gemmatimonadales bacterium]
NNSLVYGTGGGNYIPPPAQGVILRGTTVALDPKSVVDVSGGGDLQAYEWIPGVGGTRDVLSPQVRPNQFAILPGLRANVAPYDLNSAAGTSLEPGDAIYLSGAPGLPAGVYQLLPARYALLPGAFLVSPASGYQDVQPGQTFPTLDGGTVVAGYRTVAGTPFGDSRTSGFEVVPAAVVVQGSSSQAQYTTTSANQFFAAQAQSAGAPPPALPEDSGVLELLASASLALDGSLRTAPGAGGLGAAVDISSSNIRVVGTSAGAASPGELLLSATSLDQLGAQTILLGGERSGSGAVTTDSQSVTIGAGAALSAPEVLVTATGAITVESGASVAAAGTVGSSREYSLSGEGAFMSVSAGSLPTVTRAASGTATSGVLTLDPGSSLSANHGSIFLEATQNVVTSGNITAQGGDFALQSTQISIGAASGSSNPTGTVLSPSVLSAGLHNVLLQSASSIDFNGNVGFQAQNLTLDTPSLAAAGSGGTAATVTVAGALTLDNSSGTQVAALPGSGSLSLSAADVILGSGTMSMSGFRSVALSAQNAVTAKGDGGLTTAGDLSVTASRITAAAGISTDLAAGGSVSLLSPAKVAALAPVTDLGGALNVTGSRIEVGTQVLLPSGSVSLAGSGDVVLDGAGTIDVSGLVRTYDGVNIATPGGSVALNSSGNVTLASGSAVNVSAASGGVGGSLAIRAPGGHVTAAGALMGSGSAGQGSSASIDAQSFDFSVLNGALNNGGFAGGRFFRLRGASGAGAGNDLTVGAGDVITAHAVSLEADQGTVDVQGLIDASGTTGGSIVLAAAGGVSVSGNLDAQATAPGGSGGRVEIYSSGNLLLGSSSLLNVAGGGPDASGDAGGGGSVLLRVPQTTLTGGGVALGGNIQGATRTTLEAFQVFDSPTGALTAADISTDPLNSQSIYNQTAAFMANAATLTSALHPAASWNFVLEPGVEIQSTSPTGSLELDTPWNLFGGVDPTSGSLFGWRFGPNAVPGVLTLRATGGLTINSSLSDGFASVPGVADAFNAPFTLPAAPSSSWSYRLVGGADLTAANPLGVVAPSSPGASAGSVTLAACQSACALPSPGAGGRGGGSTTYTPLMVRTGDGFIDVSASGNFVLGSTASMLYTAGVLGPGPAVPVSSGRGSGAVNLSQFPIDGGDITIAVDGNVTGPGGNSQFVNAWLWRLPAQVPNASIAAAYPTTWTVHYEAFQQGVAALGGGNVAVRAGGDVTDLSVSIPSTGRPTGATTLQVAGGGNLTVQAGGSIRGGSYYAGLGSVTLDSGADLGSDAL